MQRNSARSDVGTPLLYSALQQNIHKCLYKFQITASNFLTIRKYAFKSFPCSLKFLRRIFCIFCYSAEYKGLPKSAPTQQVLCIIDGRAELAPTLLTPYTQKQRADNIRPYCFLLTDTHSGVLKSAFLNCIWSKTSTEPSSFMSA